MINIPTKVDFILNKIETNEFEAYVVGGCVRDALLNKTPNDWDITTSTPPDITEKIFSHTVPTGIKHGTITVLIDNEPFEVTTYRTEGQYENNRKPKEVTFVENIQEDLSRRDFTINAMAYNPKLGLKDYFHGQEDLKNKIIRTVGKAYLRFNEDALRMIRAIRFSTKLEFKIEKDTFRAIQENCHLIRNISVERISDELCKILLCHNPSNGILLLQESNLLTYIFPELIANDAFLPYNSSNSSNSLDYNMSVLDLIPHNLTLRLCVLLNYIYDLTHYCIDFNNNDTNISLTKLSQSNIVSKYEISKNILKRLKFDNKTIEKVTIFLENYETNFAKYTKKDLKKFINKIGVENLEEIFLLKNPMKKIKNNSNLRNTESIENQIKEILKNKEPLSIKDLEIKGEDIINIGIKKGREVGIMLNRILDHILQYPEDNKKDILLNLCSSYISTEKE